MRNPITKGIGALVLFTTVACAGNGVPSPETFSDVQRAQVEAEVRGVMMELSAAAKEGNMEPTMARVLPRGGLCVWGATVSGCQEIFERHRDAWTSGAEKWLERQEADGEEIRVVALGPTVAIGVITTDENRAIYSNGDVVKARFASLSVFVLGEDGWKMHSGQQASWDIEESMVGELVPVPKENLK